MCVWRGGGGGGGFKHEITLHECCLSMRYPHTQYDLRIIYFVIVSVCIVLVMSMGLHGFAPNPKRPPLELPLRMGDAIVNL